MSKEMMEIRIGSDSIGARTFPDEPQVPADVVLPVFERQAASGLVTAIEAKKTTGNGAQGNSFVQAVLALPAADRERVVGMLRFMDQRKDG